MTSRLLQAHQLPLEEELVPRIRTELEPDLAQGNQRMEHLE